MSDVLFVCVHNSGRSQMAKALFNQLAAARGSEYRADSAGTMPSGSVNPQAVAAMKEVGIDIASEAPKQLTPAIASSAKRMITMGCGVEASACPAGTYFSEDWGLDDPAGKEIEEVRRIRDEIRARVEALLNSIVTER